MEAPHLKIFLCSFLGDIEIAYFPLLPERWPDLSWNRSICNGNLNLTFEDRKTKTNHFELQDDCISSFRFLLSSLYLKA